MEIILHAHHAEVTDTLREQAEAAIHRIAARVHRVANGGRPLHRRRDHPSRRDRVARHAHTTTLRSRRCAGFRARPYPPRCIA